MSTAIFIEPYLGGYRIDVDKHHLQLPDGYHGLVIADDDHGGIKAVLALSEGEWEQLRDSIDQLLAGRTG